MIKFLLKKIISKIMESVSKQHQPGEHTRKYLQLKELLEKCVKHCPHEVHITLNIIKLTIQCFQFMHIHEKNYPAHSNNKESFFRTTRYHHTFIGGGGGFLFPSSAGVNTYEEFDELIDLIKRWVRIEYNTGSILKNYGIIDSTLSSSPMSSNFATSIPTNVWSQGGKGVKRKANDQHIIGFSPAKSFQNITIDEPFIFTNLLKLDFNIKELSYKQKILSMEEIICLLIIWIKFFNFWLNLN